jgi:hypothetical protein
VDPDRDFSDSRFDHNLPVAETRPGDSVAEFSSVLAIVFYKKELSKKATINIEDPGGRFNQ